MDSSLGLLLPILVIYLNLQFGSSAPTETPSSSKAYYLLNGHEPQYLNFLPDQGKLFEFLLYDEHREFYPSIENKSKWNDRVVVIVPEVTENDVYIDDFAKLKFRGVLPFLDNENVQVVGVQRGIDYEQAKKDIDTFLCNTSEKKPENTIAIPLGKFANKDFTANGKKLKKSAANNIGIIISKLKSIYFHLG